MVGSVKEEEIVLLRFECVKSSNEWMLIVVGETVYSQMRRKKWVKKQRSVFGRRGGLGCSRGRVCMGRNTRRRGANLEWGVWGIITAGYLAFCSTWVGLEDNIFYLFLFIYKTLSHSTGKSPQSYTPLWAPLFRTTIERILMERWWGQLGTWRGTVVDAEHRWRHDRLGLREY